jgi:hypothetical protein
LNPIPKRNAILLNQIESISDFLFKERCEKYKYKPKQMYFENVLFLVLIKEIGYIQDIDFSLNEQSHKPVNRDLLLY